MSNIELTNTEFIIRPCMLDYILFSRDDATCFKYDFIMLTDRRLITRIDSTYMQEYSSISRIVIIALDNTVRYLHCAGKESVKFSDEYTYRGNLVKSACINFDNSKEVVLSIEADNQNISMGLLIVVKHIQCDSLDIFREGHSVESLINKENRPIYLPETLNSSNGGMTENQYMELSNIINNCGINVTDVSGICAEYCAPFTRKKSLPDGYEWYKYETIELKMEEYAVIPPGMDGIIVVPINTSGHRFKVSDSHMLEINIRASMFEVNLFPHAFNNINIIRYANCIPTLKQDDDLSYCYIVDNNNFEIYRKKKDDTILHDINARIHITTIYPSMLSHCVVIFLLRRPEKHVAISQ